MATTVSGSSIVLDLFDDTRFLVSLKEKGTPPDAGSYTWSGRVQGHPLATFNMSVVGEATVMDVRLPGGITYAVRYRGNGIHEVQEISESAQDSCGTTGSQVLTKPEPFSGRGTHHNSFAADAADQVDVLVMFTPDAEAQAGGSAGMQSLINQAFSFANTSYTNSGVPLSLVKVAAVKTFYTPHSSDMGIDLSRYRAANDGYMDEVHAIRNAYNADMACLLRGSTAGGNCGIAYTMGAGSISTAFAPNSFAVCANECVSNQTFAHELGHNMGLHHDIGNAGGQQAAYPYSYGWRWNGSPSGLQWRSVMAYAPGSRIQYFSNPLVNFDGAPTGAALANNALTLVNTAPSVANFRQRAAASGPTLVASGNPITITIPQGQDATYKAYFGNAGTGSVNYQLSENASWATLSPLSGSATTTGANQEHTFTLDTDSLAVGPYNATVTMSAIGVANSPLIVPVVLNIIGALLNDNFAGAQLITGPNGSVNGTNVNSTREVGEPGTIGEFSAVGSHSIWYKWVAPSADAVQFTTFGSNFDTMLGCYTGTLGALALVAANDDSGAPGDPTSQIAFTPVPGTTYHFLIDGWNGATGTTKLNWVTTADVEQWSHYK